MESRRPLPAPVLSEALQWGQLLGSDWLLEFPEKPQPVWAVELEQMLGEEHARSRQTRVHRVMRRLRRSSPRAWDVLYMAMVLGYSFTNIAHSLNERAARNSIDQTYSEKDVLALFAAGVAFCKAHLGEH